MFSQQQADDYRNHGYLALERWVDDIWLNRLSSASDYHVERSKELSTSGKGLDLEPDHTAECPRLRRLTSPVDHDDTFREFALEGPAAALAQAILGGPVRFHHSKLNYKWSDGGEEVKWHQDIQFWPHTDFSPLTIGVYLDDVDDEMGPMGILPGAMWDHSSTSMLPMVPGRAPLAMRTSQRSQSLRSSGLKALLALSPCTIAAQCMDPCPITPLGLEDCYCRPIVTAMRSRSSTPALMETLVGTLVY